MENIKIFITPEANYALSDTSAVAEKYKKDAIYGLHSVIQSKTCPECMFADEKNPFGISAIWAKSPQECSYVLLYKSKKLGLAECFSFNHEHFFEQIERSLPFPLN